MKRSTPYNYSIGFPCGNNTGYCDFFQYCQRVDLEGPLLQLFNLYFTSEGRFLVYNMIITDGTILLAPSHDETRQKLLDLDSR